MKTWARLDGQQITTVAEAAASPAGAWVDITAVWPGWQTRPTPGWQPFLVAGLVEWQNPATEASAWAMVRAQRDALLTACDWVSARAFDLGVAVPTAWATYRQALRDITEQSDPFDIEWPTPPA